MIWAPNSVREIAQAASRTAGVFSQVRWIRLSYRHIRLGWLERRYGEKPHEYDLTFPTPNPMCLTDKLKPGFFFEEFVH